MDAISFSIADKQAKRIKKIINDPDSTSGVVTVPSTIASGETITIPAGRTAILPDIQIDGTLNVQGKVFIPTGTTTSKVIPRVTSTDNAIVRFDGTTGDVQNSTVIIDDTGNLTANNISSNGWFKTADTVSYTGIYFDDTALGYHSHWINGSEKMRIDSNGNVGIGVTPSAWHTTMKSIDIGTVADSGTLYSSIGYNHSHVALGTNHYYDTSFTPRYKGNYAASAYHQGNGSHYWQTAPSGTAGNAITWTNNLTLSSNGTVDVYGSGNRVIVGRDSSENYINFDSYVQCYSVNSSNYIYMLGSSVVSTTPVLESVVGGVRKSAILANGTYQSATNVYGSTSDAKLKENVVDTGSKLDKLMQVKVKNFNYIGQDEKQIGVIAQEIEQVFPGLVFETEDTESKEITKIREVTAEDGTVTEEEYTETEQVKTGEVTKNVKYSVLYMIAIKALQELNEKVELMQAEINELKGAK